MDSTSPYLAVAASAALGSAATALAVTGASNRAATVGGVWAIGLIGGYSLGSAVPSRATSAVVAIAVLLVPPVSVGLRGREFGRVSYSPGEDRHPETPIQPAPGCTALAIAIGCALEVYLLRRWRTSTVALKRDE